MLKLTSKGEYKKTSDYLKKINKLDYRRILNKYGELGVRELSKANPNYSGVTADAWSYNLGKRFDDYILSFYNSNINDGIPIVILIQYGHGTRGGTYVKGIDFINPAIQPIFEKLSKELWMEVCKL